MRRKALLDTNLLLLWVVALADLTFLRDFKRVAQFSVQDVVVLRGLLQSFATFVTTPHVLTETSNFVSQAPQYQRAKLTAALQAFTKNSVEIYEPSQGLAEGKEFVEFGLTDAALLSLSREATILTIDGGLYARVLAMGGSAVNLRHGRRLG